MAGELLVMLAPKIILMDWTGYFNRRIVSLCNVFRGKGRSPWCSEPGAVVLISDGKNASAGAEDCDEPRSLDMNTVKAWASGAIGSDLCGKPFRWDQRLFALMLGGGSGGDGVEVTAGDDRGGLGWDALETQAALKVSPEPKGDCKALVRWVLRKTLTAFIGGRDSEINHRIYWRLSSWRYPGFTSISCVNRACARRRAGV